MLFAQVDPRSNDDKPNGILTWQGRLEQALDRLDLVEASKLLQELEQDPSGNDKDALKLSRETWNKIFQAIEERTSRADQEMFQNINARNSAQQTVLAEFPAQSVARTEMTQLYETLKDAGQLQLFGAVDLKDRPPVGGSHTVPPPVLEHVTGLSMSSLTPQPTNTLLLAGVALAVVEVLVSVSTAIPLNVLALVTVALVLLDRIAVNGAVLESALKVLQPGTQKKIVQHEAGHFLAAYLLGCPVEGIVLSAWAALRDGRFGGRQVSAGTSFYDPQLSSQMNSGGGKITRSSIDRYSTIVMAGIAAEAFQNGRADGGAGDELALIAFLSQLNANSPRSAPLWTGDGIRNQARWGAMQAVMLLKAYRPAYDALVDAMERGGSLGECVYAIEKAARRHQLSTLSSSLGYIVEDGPAGQVSFRNATSTTEDAVNVFAGDDANGIRRIFSILPPNPSASASSRSKSTTKAMDEEESLQTLGEIRAKVEERLRSIEQKLKEIET
jgi:hypothetical protein